MTDQDPSLGELFLSDLQDIEDCLGELAMTADAILQQSERLSGSDRRPAATGHGKDLIHARELLLAIANDAQRLVEAIDDSAASPPGAPPVPADELLAIRLDGLAKRAAPSTPSLGL